MSDDSPTESTVRVIGTRDRALAQLKHKNPQQYAQSRLIDTALRLAVDALYAKCSAEHWEVDTVLADGRNLGGTKAAVMEAIRNSGDEYKQVRTFNLLAKKNGFDLSLKTSGMKTPDSMQRKLEMYPEIPLHDAARMSVVSSDPEQLNGFTNAIKQAIDNMQDDEDKKYSYRPNIEPWGMRANAILFQRLKTSIHGVGTEVQFLPREQARVATRISHHLFEVSRVYEDAIDSIDSLDDPGRDIATLAKSSDPAEKAKAIMLIQKMEATEQSLNAYNQIARFMNKLGSDDIMSAIDKDAANEMLKELQESNQSYDEEGQDGSEKPGHSPIFKTLNDLKTYRTYMKTQGQAMGLFPLPEVSQNTSRRDMEAAMLKLFRCNQLTHACYMGDASEPMRNLWVKHAHASNANLDDAKKIPAGAITAVNHTLKPSELGGDNGRPV
jgi:hypothetical protein